LYTGFEPVFIKAAKFFQTPPFSSPPPQPGCLGSFVAGFLTALQWSW
jgi:hypothetical protein